MLRQNPKKHTVREVFEVIQEDGNELKVQKIPNQLLQRQHRVRNKLYTVSKDQVFGVQFPKRQLRQSTVLQRPT